MRIVSYAINYSNPYFNGAKRKNEKFERTVIGILQDYINFKISKEEIKRKISELNSQAEIFSFKLPEWYVEISDYLFLDEEETDEVYVRHQIMKFLQNIKNEGKYKDILKQDYMSYL